VIYPIDEPGETPCSSDSLTSFMVKSAKSAGSKYAPEARSWDRSAVRAREAESVASGR